MADAYAPADARAAVEAFLAANQATSLLRFITCGSVDDGKSTLIGRLLYDAKLLFEDQVEALEDGGLDFASLVDGLSAEREQGITIDVAYRYFATDKRKFIVADAPGHEQYTRNMATGASTADAAVILVDARKGVLNQTRRHSYIAALLGIREVVLVVNKMDLVFNDQAVFNLIAAEYRAVADKLGIGAVQAIPAAALHGDNVSRKSAAMPWYDGPTLIEQLERIPVRTADAAAEPFRMAVQWVNRAGQDFRGYAGTISSGCVRPGDTVRILPGEARCVVDRIVTADGDLDEAVAGQAVTLTFTEEVGCARGDVIAAASQPPSVADRLDAMLVWMAGEPLVPGRAYWLKIGTQLVSASVARVVDLVDMATLEPRHGEALHLNDIGRCELVLDRPVVALPYAESRDFGGFILIDRASNGTVAAGMVQALPDSAGEPAAEHGHGRILWLSGAPDERIAFARRYQQRMQARGRPTVVLDEEGLQVGLNSDLSGPHAEPERQRRIRELARMMSEAGLVVLVATDMPADERHGTSVDVSKGDLPDD
ncbi:GTP-binding protein [Sphingosinicella sp. YJ22]|uniref:GTP-binding protein n=1 Tax=Sphingosinicella sp. YJ22 TaxID=1104780 RepID=UPI00140DAFF4|nr:GTP-binding protein [Sphingosinicella sp. YJ22]